MTEQNHILHFSLGPVQGFIGGARRTRDLWAGSFLLSWLTARAMAVVRAKHNGGQIVFPAVDKDPLVRSVEKSLRSLAPRIGTVPNRFKAEVPEEFEPKRCEEAVRAAWRKLADAVWDEFLPRLDERLKKLNGGLPARTKQIWEDQVRNFWEISWVKGPDDGIDGEWLEHRKTWRNHRPPDEAQGGDHCTLMGDWQEISGYVRARDRADQDTFWSEFRECEFRDSIGDRNGKKLLLDIVEGERLCAIALIKRLFPRLPRETREVFGWDPCGDGGGNWPSTGHIAAAHWINKAWTTNEESNGACGAYTLHVKERFAELHFAEQHSMVACVARIAPSGLKPPHWFGALDANFFDRNDLDNRRAMPLIDRKTNQAIEAPNAKEHQDLIDEYDLLIAKLRKAVPDLGAPAGYFALLRMDGDDVGRLLDTLGADKVSQALAAFSKEVPRLVENNNGVLVYAGGDDLLALFPIESALTAALKLRGAYRSAWHQANRKASPPAWCSRIITSRSAPWSRSRAGCWRTSPRTATAAIASHTRC